MSNQFHELFPSDQNGPGEGLWTEENVSTLLKAAIPAPDPEPLLLMRVQRGLEAAVEAQPYLAHRRRTVRLLQWTSAIYLLILLGSATLGLEIRSELAAHQRAIVTYQATHNQI